MARAKPTPDLTAEDIDADLAAMRSEAEQDAYINQLTPEQADMYQQFTAKARPPEGPQVIRQIGDSAVARPQPGVHYKATDMIVDQVPPEVAKQMYLPSDINRFKSLHQQSADPRDSEGLLDNKVGLVARAAAQGAMALPGMGFDFVTQTPGFTQQAVDLGMDKLGAMRPETSGQRIFGDIVSGASGVVTTGGLSSAAGLIPGATERLLGRVAARPVAQVVSGGLGGGASGLVREEGGSQGQQVAAALAAGLSPQIISSLTKPVITGGLPGKLAPMLDAFETSGHTPSVGQLTGGNKAQGLESFLSKFYGSSGKMGDFYRGQQAAIGDKFLERADELAPATVTTPERLGQIIENQYTDIAKPAIKAKREALQAEISKHIPGDPMVQAGNLNTTIDELAAPNAVLPNSSKNSVLAPNLNKFQELRSSWRKDMAIYEKQQLAAGVPQSQLVFGAPLSGVRWMKTRIGSLLDDSVVNSDIPSGELKRLSGSITEDVKNFMKTQSPAAQQAFDDMNKWEINYHKQADLLRSVLDKNGGTEKVFEAAFGATKSGPSTVRAVYNVLTPKAKEILTAGFMRRMARTTPSNPDEFDLTKLFGNINALDPTAKKVIFGHLGPEFTSDLDKLSTTLQRIGQGNKDFGIQAGSQGSLGIQMPLYLLASAGGATAGGQVANAGSALAGAIASTGAVVLSARTLAGWMTNPHVVRWLASHEVIPSTTYNSTINLLAQEGRKKNDPDLIELADYLKSQEGQ